MSIWRAAKARSPSAPGRAPSMACGPFTDPSQISGVDWILAENWMPYQLISFVTPPFAGYVSGHSTYSRTGAEVLTLLTGSALLPRRNLRVRHPDGVGAGLRVRSRGRHAVAVRHLLRRFGPGVAVATQRRDSPGGRRFSRTAHRQHCRSGGLGIMPSTCSACPSRRASCWH